MASSPTPHHSASFLFTNQPPSYSYGGNEQHAGGSQRDHNIGVLVLSFFSIALFLTVLYCLYTWLSSLSATSRAATAAATTEEGEDRDGFGIGYGGLFQSGLNKKMIAGLQKRPHEGESEDCAICLSKMVVGDLVKIMPICEHGFHSECVEEWLKAQATCPMCRTYLITVPTKPKGPVDPLDMA